MNELPEAALRRKPQFTFVWFVPLLALLLAAGLAYARFRDRGPLIEIKFSQAPDITPKKTLIKHRGVNVGAVTGIRIDDDGEGVLVTARLTRSAAGLAREGTTFLIVKPEVSFSGIQGLSTIFSGSYITVHPGKGDPATQFRGYADLQEEGEAAGLPISLTAPHAGSIQVGDGVFYRGIRVGVVTRTGLSETGQSAVIHARIDYKFDQYVRRNSIFWIASGLHAKIGLLGAKVHVESMDTLVRGGIALATPDPAGERIKSGASFTLLSEAPKGADTWQPKL